MELVTGYKGASHVTAEQVADFQAGVFGNGNYILNIGSKFRCDINSANKVTVNDGVLIMQGRQIIIENNDSEQINVENGTMDMKRHDLIVVKYEKSVDNTESASLAIIKGVTATNPVDPVVPYLNADIRSGADVSQLPLYRIVIDGLAISSTECLVENASSIKDILEIVAGGIKKVNNKTPDASGNVQLSASDVGARANDWNPPNATTSAAGLMSASDKTNLNNYASKIISASGTGWVQFADGTQICWGSVTKTISGTEDITTLGNLKSVNFNYNTSFAKSFTAKPIILGSFGNEWTMMANILADSSKVTSVRINTGTNGTAVGKSITLNYVAFGRWK